MHEPPSPSFFFFSFLFPSLSVITFFFCRTLTMLCCFAFARQPLTLCEVLPTTADNVGSTGRNTYHSGNDQPQRGHDVPIHRGERPSWHCLFTTV